MLSLNKFLPHTEDKVLALKKISSLTGYSEKCHLLFQIHSKLRGCSMSIFSTTQKHPHTTLCSASHVFSFFPHRTSWWCRNKAFHYCNNFPLACRKNNSDTKGWIPKHKSTAALLIAFIRKSPQALHQSASLSWNQKEGDMKLFPLLEKAASPAKRK